MAEQAMSHVIPAPVPKELERIPLVANNRSLGWITDKIAGVAEGKTPMWWWIAFVPSVFMLLVLVAMLTYLVTTGVGVWGLNHPVMWGWAIVNFVWWIGIGHAGTLISAILFLLRQRWRTASQPRRRSHDDFRRHVRRNLSGGARGTRVVWLVALSAAESKRHLAAVPFAADVGRVRRLDLLHRVRVVLVYGAGSGFGNHARPRENQATPVSLWPVRAGLDRVEPQLEQL